MNKSNKVMLKQRNKLTHAIERTQTNTQTQQQTRKSLHFEPTRKNMFFHSLHQTQK